MRLLKYKVHKFRSVKGTDWIDIDNLACYVGVNESGKTNLLLPLWKFNPADGATNIDLLLDYPRDEYSEIKSKKGLKGHFFIETVFELDQSEIDEFEKRYCAQVDTTTSEDESETKSESKPREKYGFKKHLLIKKDYNETFYIYLSDENGEELSEELEDEVGKEVFDEVRKAIPSFVYYSEYGNLDSDLYLPRVKEDLERINQLTGKDRMKARTLKVLFGHLGLEPEDILELGQEVTPNNNPVNKSDEQVGVESRNKQERYAKVTSAASRLTTQFKDWWTQGNYIFHFNADGQYFRILVSDTERTAPIELESRSKGLQWFFSFFLVFLAERKDSHKNCVLLLDEPGLSLHPSAQTDLIRFFNQVSEGNQVIYTTHLPFLVDHNNLDRVKAVYTEKGLTLISNDLGKADKERKSIQPVNAAIGITASQSLLVGCDIVIVEGVSDQHYLTMIKNHLISEGKFQPSKEMAFIPVGGVRGVKPVVSIVQGTKSALPVTLLDSDQSGKTFQSGLKSGLYSSDKDKVIETDTFTGKEGSEIEDLIPLDLIVDCFDRIFRTEDGIDTDDVNSNLPIVPQLEEIGKANDLRLEEQHGWKVELSKRVKQKFKGNVPEDIEKSWIELFNKIKA
tara:strand:+ start:35321 stop:37189 length:1869 start_codon:yes stop_codon:yes gene_type:complete